MKRNLLVILAAVLACFTGGGISVMRAAATDIPTQQGTYIKLKADDNVTATEAKVESENSIGSTGAKSVLVFNLNNTKKGNYILSFNSGAVNVTSEWDVTVTGTNGYKTTKSISVVHTGGSWTPVTLHALALDGLPEGQVTMTMKCTHQAPINGNNQGYAGNFGNFGVYDVNSYDNISSIDLQKGTYANGARYEDANKNIGYIKNGASASYTAYNFYDGKATLNMGLTFYNAAVMNVTVTDALTGKEEVNKDFNITKDICKGYDNPTSFDLGELTKGLKSISLKFTNESGFICNYKNLGISISNDVTVGSTGFATIGFPYAVSLPEGMKAYAITSVDNNTVTLTEVNGSVAANTGLIVSAKPGTYTFAPATEGAEVAGNKLVANTGGTKTAGKDADFYVLGIVNAASKTVGMMPIAAAGTVGQYKAYLPASEVSATAAAKGLKIVIAGQPTAVEGVQVNEPDTNGSTAIYNLAGQRVNAAAKGIYIINGHKYIK